MCDFGELPSDADSIVKIPEMSFSSFVRSLRARDIQGIALISVVEASDLDLRTTSTLDVDVLDASPNGCYPRN
jgi:hypothetical protein